MSGAKVMQCDGCFWFHGELVSSENYGRCLRYPPQVVIVEDDIHGGDRALSLAPVTRKESVCGEWNASGFAA